MRIQRKLIFGPPHLRSVGESRLFKQINVFVVFIVLYFIIVYCIRQIVSRGRILYFFLRSTWRNTDLTICSVSSVEYLEEVARFTCIPLGVR